MNKKNAISYKEWFVKRSDAIRFSLINGAVLDVEDFKFISNRLIAEFCGESYQDNSKKLCNINELVDAIKIVYNSFDLNNYYEINHLKQTITELLNKKFKFKMLYSNEINKCREKITNRHAILDKYLVGYEFVCLDASARDFILKEAVKLKEKKDKFIKKQDKHKNKSLINRLMFSFMAKYKQEKTNIYDVDELIEIN